MKSKLVVVGAWGLFDHFMAMEKYPADGETICLDPHAVSAQQLFFGDCSGNIAAVAAGLGVETGLVTVVGWDFSSSGYRKHLEELGVDLSGVTVLEQYPSGHNYNCFSPDGSGFCISQQGAAAHQQPGMIREEWFRDAAYTVVCEAFSPYTLKALRCAGSWGSTTVISGMVGDRNSLWQDFLQAADILFINRSEFRRLVQLVGSEDALFRKFDLERIFITCGADGARIIDRSEDLQIPVVQAEAVIDPTGAGDAFVAGTIAGLLRGLEPQRAAGVGAAASSFIIQKFGCQTNAPTWEQVRSRIEAQSETVGGRDP